MRTSSLKNTSDFDRVFALGTRVHAGLLSIVVARGHGTTKVGLAVNKRIGGAVIRNRIKRIFREAFWAIAGNLTTPAEIVILPKTLVKSATSKEVAVDLKKALFKAGLFER